MAGALWAVSPVATFICFILLVVIFMFRNKLYHHLIMGYVGYIQTKARSLNTGPHCLKMANMSISLESSENNKDIHQAFLKITIIKLSVVKDLRSLSSLETPTSPKSKKSGTTNLGINSKKRASGEDDPTQRLETEERDILSDRSENSSKNPKGSLEDKGKNKNTIGAD